MTERSVTIRLGIQDEIGNRLLEIRKQRDALLSKSIVNLRVNADGIDQARKVSSQVRGESAAAVKDLGALGEAITSKAVAPLAQYQELLGSAVKASRALASGAASALGVVSQEFQRQKTLEAFWGVSGLQMGVISLKSTFSGFLSTSGRGFTSWLQNASANLAQYRTALAASAAVLVGFAAAAGLSSKHAQNYISSTLSSRLMERKLSDKAGAEAWIQEAQGTDWSKGRESRMGVFQTVLSKNPYMGQKGAQKATEDIEKFFFANQEMLQKKGIQSAEDLASRVSAPQLSGEDASIFEDIFGLGFNNMTAQARLGRISTEAKDINIEKAVAMRPDEVLTKRLTATTQAVGDTVLPILNQVLGAFLTISDAIGKIPGLGKAIGWATVLAGAASAGLIMVSMVGTLIPGLMTVIGLFSKLGIVTKLAAAGQWILNAAMTANPLGIAIMAIAGLIVVLYALEKKFGLVTKAWRAFSGSSIGKGIFAFIEDGKKCLEEMLTSLNKAFKGQGVDGVLKIALGALVAGSSAFKILAILVDFLKKLWINSGLLNKLFQSGMGLWQRMVDFFSWLLNSIKSGVQWIKDGLGITKAEKEKARDEIAEKEGVYWSDKKGTWVTKESGGTATATPSPRLARAQEEYENAPDSIFSKIGEVISGAMSSIAKLFDPVLNPLKTAIEDLVAWLEKWFGNGEEPSVDVVNPETGIGQQGDTTTGTGESSGTGGIETPRQFYSTAPSKEFGKFDVLKGSTVMATFDTEAKSKQHIASLSTPAPAMAAGGQIRATGSLIGHGGEEMDPARVVAGGKTTLARINEMFSGGSASSLASPSITIQAPPVHISIGRVEKDVDVNRLFERAGEEFDRKLLFRLRNSLNTMGLRDIGYMRG